MTGSETDSVQERYAAVCAGFAGEPGVDLGGGGRRGFGSNALRVNEKIFAMVDSRGEFVVKLPRARVDELVDLGEGVRFDPGHGRVMKEWLVVSAGSSTDWTALAREAMQFVGSGARAR